MGNEVANPFGNGPVMGNRQEMAKRAAASSQNSSRNRAPDNSDYLNFSGKRGLYTIGKDKRRVENDELWILNIGSFEEGYVCWKGGRPASTRMANIYTGVPVEQPSDDDQGPFNAGKGEGWFFARAWVSKSIDTDEQGYFKNNSVSGVGEMADLVEECSRRMAVGQPCWPVFKYDMEEFEAQGHKNFKPIFNVYGWLDDEALAKTAADDFDIDELIAQSEVAGLVSDKTSDEAAPPASEEGSEDTDPPEEPKTRSRRRRRSAA